MCDINFPLFAAFSRRRQPDRLVHEDLSDGLVATREIHVGSRNQVGPGILSVHLEP